MSTGHEIKRFAPLALAGKIVVWTGLVIAAVGLLAVLAPFTDIPKVGGNYALLAPGASALLSGALIVLFGGIAMFCDGAYRKLCEIASILDRRVKR